MLACGISNDKPSSSNNLKWRESTKGKCKISLSARERRALRAGLVITHIKSYVAGEKWRKSGGGGVSSYRIRNPNVLW